MDNIYILLLAIAIDLIIGDPPTRFHPVGWMGKLISFLEHLSPKTTKEAQIFYGIAVVLFSIAVFSISTYFLLEYVEKANNVACIIAGALILKSTFSIKGLYKSASKIKNQLQNNDITEARNHMPELVSRDPSKLSEEQVTAATVESIAENTSDSFVAPLFWFLILGIPGAIAYRVANTFDSMIGYHGKYEYLGKFAAKLDDLLNLIPARLTGAMIVLAASLVGKNGRLSWHIMIRDHSKTESPNAGWPMSAAAGALGVKLEKLGHYQLGNATDTLSVEKIDSMLRLMCLVVTIWSLLCLGIEGVKLALTS